MSKKTFNKRASSNDNRRNYTDEISRYRNIKYSEEEDNKREFDFTEYNRLLQIIQDDAERIGGVRRLIERLSRELFSSSLIPAELDDKIGQSLEQYEKAKSKMAEVCHPVVKQIFENQMQEYQNILIPVNTEVDSTNYNVSVRLKYTYKLESMNVYDTVAREAYRQEIEKAFQHFKKRVLESSFVTVPDVFREEIFRAKEVSLKRILTLHIPLPD